MEKIKAILTKIKILKEMYRFTRPIIEEKKFGLIDLEAKFILEYI